MTAPDLTALFQPKRICGEGRRLSLKAILPHSTRKHALYQLYLRLEPTDYHAEEQEEAYRLLELPPATCQMR